MIDSNKGQKRRGTPPGESLYNIVKNIDITNIVDVGTWKGLGTTKCILDGIINSNKKLFNILSIESNKLFLEEAKINLGFLPKNFNLVHGSLINKEDLYKYRNDPDVNQTWLEQDILNINTAPNVFNLLPEKIDLLIIDGGEYSGEIEFNMLKDRTTYFFLDDINEFKNRNNRDFILDNPDLFEVLDYNNFYNYLICKKK